MTDEEFKQHLKDFGFNKSKAIEVLKIMDTITEAEATLDDYERELGPEALRQLMVIYSTIKGW